MQPNERVIFSSADPAATRAAYPNIPPSVRVFGPWTGALNSDGERVTLSDKNGVPVCSMEFNDGGSWPAAADGTGHSLVLINENDDVDDFLELAGQHVQRRNTWGNPQVLAAEESVPEILKST